MSSKILNVLRGKQGNNYCKSRGIKPGKEFSQEDLEYLWDKYAKQNAKDNRMKAVRAKKFLRHLAKEIDVSISQDDVQRLLQDCIEGDKGLLSKEEFLKLFYRFRASDDVNLPLTTSLERTPEAVKYTPELQRRGRQREPQSDEDRHTQHDEYDAHDTEDAHEAIKIEDINVITDDVDLGMITDNVCTEEYLDTDCIDYTEESYNLRESHGYLDDDCYDIAFDEEDGLHDECGSHLSDQMVSSSAIVMREEDVFEQMKIDASEMGHVYALSAEESLQILSRLEWVVSRLTEAEDIEALRSDCGIVSEVGKETVGHFLERNEEQYECICCMDDELDGNEVFELTCGHVVCVSCWQQNIRVCLSDYRPSAIECPATGCNFVLLDSHVRQLATAAQYQRYQTLFVENYIRVKKNLIYCNSPKCNEILKLRNLCTNDFQVQCNCGEVFCFNCAKNKLTERGEGHYPATCAQFQQWLRKTEEGVFSFRKKPCPKCKTPIIKCGCPPNNVVCEDKEYCPNQACNHMNCPQCSYHFCWICLKPWAGHNDYYTCKFVLPDQVRNREYISGYAEVFLKYKDYSGNSRGFRDQRQWARDQFEALRKDGKTTRATNFLLEAVDELAMCYLTLANSYVLYFYNDFDGNDNVIPGVGKELFEFNQKNLENVTNQLSVKIKIEVKPVVEKHHLDLTMVDELMSLTKVIHDYRKKLFITDF